MEIIRKEIVKNGYMTIEPVVSMDKIKSEFINV